MITYKFFIPLFIMFFINNVKGQQYAVDRGAFILSGVVDFSGSGGRLFEDIDGKRLTEIFLGTAVNYFVMPNLFIGSSVEFSNISQGDFNSVGIGFGPQIGYSFGSRYSYVFPYLSGGFRYSAIKAELGSHVSKSRGTDIVLGAGLIIPVRTHLGIIIEANYHMKDLKDKDTDISEKGNVISFGIGISGLLF